MKIKPECNRIKVQRQKHGAHIECHAKDLSITSQPRPKPYSYLWWILPLMVKVIQYSFMHFIADLDANIPALSQVAPCWLRLSDQEEAAWYLPGQMCDHVS